MTFPADPCRSKKDEKTQIAHPWLEVLVDCRGNQEIYTYCVPPHLALQAGDIVTVPLGSQQVGGIALRGLKQLPENLSEKTLRPVLGLVMRGFFPPSYWQLLQRIADYYCTELMAVLRVALPPGLLGRSQRRVRLLPDAIPPGWEAFCSPAARQVLALLRSQARGDYSRQHLCRQVKGAERGIRELSERGWLKTYVELPSAPRPQTQRFIALGAAPSPSDKLSSRQAELLQLLKARGGEMAIGEFLTLYRTTLPTLKKLAQLGYVSLEERESLRLERGLDRGRDRPPPLTPAQARALEKIQSLHGPQTILLHGVTGSGKTEVYLQAIAPVLERGQSALVLVPEIGLTPQLTDRFRARFGDRVCVYHSGLSEGERYDTWRQMVCGHPQVAIGTRSAIFAPLPHLGAIVLDEEHDSSYKQAQSVPTYHARTIAQWRSQLENCPLILGSATPSLETWHARSNPSCHYLPLPERIADRPLPPVEVVDMRRELLEGNRSLFSRSLEKAIQNLGDRQGILFINRRGHSTFVSCRSCGSVMACPNCDISLSYHYTHVGAAELLRCHYCNYATRQPRHCPDCQSPYLKFFGSGTQKVTQTLSDRFPNLRWLRFDSDTTRTKDAHRRLLSEFTSGQADLLVGTQMLSKGLDLESVTLVGILAADSLLYHSDYRAAERAFQTLTQVAGRAGRGSDSGRVILQTYSPDHPVIQAVREHDYQSFIDRELPQREELGFPPYGKLILLKVSGEEEAEVEATIATLHQICDRELGDIAELLGPAPANIARVARRYRWQLAIKFADLGADFKLDWLQLRRACPRSVSLAIDVDPMSID